MAKRIPTPIRDVDVMALPLSTLEGFVLSRVDGSASVEDIAMMVAVDAGHLVVILERLADLGAVQLDWLGSGPVLPPRQSANEPSGPPSEIPVSYDPEELEEDVDIPMERRKQILDAFHSVGHMDLYRVLGVDPDADKKQIRTAYFKLSKRFHPDALFGKELGSFRRRMEVVFKRLTEAYETLGRANRRAAYDEYLALAKQTKKTDHKLKRVRAQARSMGNVSVPRVVREEVATRPSQPRQPPPRTTPGPAGAQPAARPSRPTTPAPSGTAPVDHLAEAKQAEAQGDLVGALRALQFALTLDSERSDVAEEYQRISARLALEMADNYEKQAVYEETSGKWEQAAASWQRVVEGRPRDGRAACSAANALLKAGGDLHKAQKHAQSAVELNPEDLLSLAVLARVYLAAGLKRSARRELEKAAKLDPDDEMVKNLLEQVG